MWKKEAQITIESVHRRQSNIFDPIEPRLDQKVYSGTKPKKSVISFIEKLYRRALDKELGVTGNEWADLYLTGSLTTYQYSDTSDCDISIFPDYDVIYARLGLDPIEARKKLIHLSIEHLDGTVLPGSQHPLQFFVEPQGVLPGDKYKPGIRSGYSLDSHRWIVPPEADRSHEIQLEYPDAFSRAADMADKMKQMLDAGDTKAADSMWHEIHAKRQLDQQAGLGDFSEGNIIYKWFLHEGLFDRIRNELHEYIAKVAADLWDDRVTQKVIYNFDRDTVTLGTQATIADQPDSHIIGEYDDGIVTLYDMDKHWVSPQYFKRLWGFSYPDKPLEDVYYKRGEDRIKLKTIRKRRSNWKKSIADTPKFYNGDHVIMKAYGEFGTIIGEPYRKDDDWWYLVRTQESQGMPADDILYPERDMERPSRYDEPESLTLQDLFGITPEAEDYYRGAGWKIGREASPELQQVAQNYTQNVGLPYNPPQDFSKVDPQRAAAIAAEYEKLEHNPNDPQVKAAYDALIRETYGQYQALKSAGYNFEFYPPNSEPYATPHEAVADIRNNKHLYVFPTYRGYGQGDDDGLGDVDHPLINHSGEYWNEGERTDTPVTHNDIFRAVHDVFGHAKEGYGFRAQGEDNAFRQHRAMYSPEAQRALTTETRGQNSWVNFGPHGDSNQKANQNETVYADQKAGLLPDWGNPRWLRIII